MRTLDGRCHSDYDVRQGCEKGGTTRQREPGNHCDLRHQPFKPYNAEIIDYKPWRAKGYPQFDILDVRF